MKKGFSIIEIIIILFIIAIGLLGLLSLIIQNIQSQGYNQRNFVAYQLAQEGIELIRMVRDTNWLQGESFNEGLMDGEYVMGYLDDLPQPAGENASDLILRQEQDGFYQHGGVAPSSGFSRKIILLRENANTLSVLVQITWQDKGRNAFYDLETELYDWK